MEKIEAMGCGLGFSKTAQLSGYLVLVIEEVRHCLPIFMGNTKIDSMGTSATKGKARTQNAASIDCAFQSELSQSYHYHNMNHYSWFQDSYSFDWKTTLRATLLNLR